MSSSPPDRPGTTASVTSKATTHTQHSTATHHTGSASAATAAGNDRVVVEHKEGDHYARKCVLYTGPEGMRPHRMAVEDQYQYVGNNARSPETSSSLSYLFRSPKDVPFPKAKNGRIGETGWEQENIRGFSMSRGEFVK